MDSDMRGSWELHFLPPFLARSARERAWAAKLSGKGGMLSKAILTHRTGFRACSAISRHRLQAEANIYTPLVDRLHLRLCCFHLLCIVAADAVFSNVWRLKMPWYSKAWIAMNLSVWLIGRLCCGR